MLGEGDQEKRLPGTKQAPAVFSGAPGGARR